MNKEKKYEGVFTTEDPKSPSVREFLAPFKPTKDPDKEWFERTFSARIKKR